MAAPKFDEDYEYTYADFERWDDDFHAEIIDGKLFPRNYDTFAMGEPAAFHQSIAGELQYRFRAFLEGKPCKVFPAPFGVRLFPDEQKRDKNVVIPDMTVICDKSKITKAGCSGAPDLVVEILSPSTASVDMVYKFRKYLQAGVKEYWVVDPEAKSVIVYLLEGERYFAHTYGEKDTVPVTVLPGLEIKLAEVFVNPAA